MADSSKYRIKKKKQNKETPAKQDTGIQKEPPLIGKGNILIMLLIGIAIVAGIYIAAMQTGCEPVFHIYWAVTTVLLCIFIFMYMKNKDLYARLTYNRTPTEEEKQNYRKRMKKMKLILIVLIPFLLTVLGDVIYLILLKDLDIFKAVSDLFK